MDELGARALDEEPDPREIESAIEVALTESDVWIKVRRSPEDEPRWAKYPPEQAGMLRSMFSMMIGAME